MRHLLQGWHKMVIQNDNISSTITLKVGGTDSCQDFYGGFNKVYKAQPKVKI